MDEEYYKKLGDASKKLTLLFSSQNTKSFEWRMEVHKLVCEISSIIDDHYEPDWCNGH